MPLPQSRLLNILLYHIRIFLIKRVVSFLLQSIALFFTIPLRCVIVFLIFQELIVVFFLLFENAINSCLQLLQLARDEDSFTLAASFWLYDENDGWILI